MIHSLQRAALTLLFLLLPIPSMAQAPSKCKATLDPLAARAGGAAELIGDLVLDCTGAGGTAPGRLEILLVANVPFGNRDLSPIANRTWGLTDALLLVDDPQPASQKVCVLANPSATCADNAGFNVFQGERLQENLIAFQAVPISPAAVGSSRRIRIVNLRRGPDPVAFPTATLQILIYSGGQTIPVDNGLFDLPPAQPPVLISVLTGTGVVPGALTGVEFTPSQLPSTRPNPVRGFRVKVTEGFASAFRRRSIASTSADPSRLASQAVPGVRYATETGFYNTAFPLTNSLSTAGRAESGTRLKITLYDVPPGVQVWAAIQDQPLATSSAPARAVLTRTNADGGGNFTRLPAEYESFVPLQLEDGVASGVWEIVAADASAIEEMQFVFALSSREASIGLGTAFLSVDAAPIASASLFQPNADEPSETVYPLSYPSFLLPKEEPLAPGPIPPGPIVPTYAIPAFSLVATPDVPPAKLMSAASMGGRVSPGSIATLLGSELSALTATAGLPVIAPLAGTTVTIVDATGVERPTALYLVSPTQINLLIGPETPVGPAIVNVWHGQDLVASASFEIDFLAPALFSADGSGTGPPSGSSLPIGDIAQEPASLSVYDNANNTWFAAQLQTGAAPLYLFLYGTGFRNRGDLSTIHASIGGQTVPVIWAAPSPGLPGLEKLTLGPVPAALFGRGAVPLAIQAGEITSNQLTVFFGN